MTTTIALALAAHPGHGHTAADTAAHYAVDHGEGVTLALTLVALGVALAIAAVIRDRRETGK